MVMTEQWTPQNRLYTIYLFILIIIVSKTVDVIG